MHAAAHLWTGCGSSSSRGKAYIRGLCRSPNGAGVTKSHSSSPWRIFAHELGHNLGAEHTFQNGVGRTGGIMDYGNFRVDGTIQFNTRYSKGEICSFLNSVVSRCSGNFNPSGGGTTTPTRRRRSGGNPTPTRRRRSGGSSCNPGQVDRRRRNRDMCSCRRRSGSNDLSGGMVCQGNTITVGRSNPTPTRRRRSGGSSCNPGRVDRRRRNRDMCSCRRRSGSRDLSRGMVCSGNRITSR